jgi:hypothetical protein
MKHCPTCNETKQNYRFHKDKSRPDGLNWQCIECTKARRQERRDAQTRENMRDNATFNELYRDPELQKYVEQQTRKYARQRPELQLDLAQEAWFAIAAEPSTSADELKRAAHRAVERTYRREYEYGKRHEHHADMAVLEEMLAKQATGQTMPKPDSDKIGESDSLSRLQKMQSDVGGSLGLDKEPDGE